MMLLLLALLAGVLALSVQAAPSCLDENGRPVDSWVVLKQANGFNYYYMNGATWTKSKNTLDQGTKGMVMATAAQAYGGGVMMGMYNDEMLGTSVSGTKAHAKGVLVSDKKQGFWIVHSMPKWPKPALTSRTSGPGPFDSGTYGQSIMCISVSAATADTIAANLMIEDVFLTGKSSLPSTSAFPNFTKWLAGAADTSRSQIVSQIKTLGGQVFVQFAKSRGWGKDIWDDFVSPYYKTPMAVETWRNGVGGRIGSVCSAPSGPKKQPYDVMAVSTVTMPDGTSWSGTDDHSKWGVSINGGGKDVFCVGGMNRMCSQEKRGGGALCSQSADGHKAFRLVATAMENCWGYNPCKGAKASDTCYWC